MPNQQTRPASPEDARPEPLLGIFIPPAPGLPKGALFVVGVPLTAAASLLSRYMPKAVVEVEGEALEAWRAA